MDEPTRVLYVVALFAALVVLIVALASAPIRRRPNRQALTETIEWALHTGVCDPDGETCCWDEEITPCAEVDLSRLAGHIAASIVHRGARTHV